MGLIRARRGEVILQLARFVDQALQRLVLSVFDHVVSHLGGEHVGVAESALDQRREISRDRGAVMLFRTADDPENCVADELGGRDVEGLGSGLDLFPLGLGEADAAVLADNGVLV